MTSSATGNSEHWIHLYDQHERRGADRYGERRIRLPGRWRTIPNGVGKYWIDWSDLTGAGPDGDGRALDVDAVIAEERAYGRSLGREFEWKLYEHDRPANLKAKLIEAGFDCPDPEAVVVARVDDVRARLRDRRPETPGRWTVHRPGPDGIDAVGQVLEAVYDEPFDDLGRRLADQLAHAPEEVDVVVIEERGEPVSTGWSWYRSGSPFATLWGGATVPSARGQGAYKALLAARLDEAAARGRTLASLDAGSMSRPILARLGFVTVEWCIPCVAQPS